MKVAIVHDYLNQLGGAERVVAVLHEMFPEAPVYTLLVDKDKLWPEMENAHIVPSFLQRFGFIHKRFKLFFWLYPLAMRTIRVGGYDLILSSSSAYGKGFTMLPKEDGSKPLHICYCHTPMRFAWDFDRYIANETNSALLKQVARWLTPVLRAWDVVTSKSVDIFIANSTAVQKRILDYFGRESLVIPPPVEIQPSEPKVPGDYFLVVSRLVSYKRIDLVVQACTAAGWSLVVIGDGPDRKRLEAMAGPTVQFLGFVSNEEKKDYMSRCIAFIFPGEEDFGITPVEANGFGRPVVAYRAGGALDTIVDGVNGVFFDEQSVDSLLRALNEASNYTWTSARIRAEASRFGTEKFKEKIINLIEETCKASLGWTGPDIKEKELQGQEVII